MDVDKYRNILSMLSHTTT